MGELSYVYASTTSVPDQLAFSSMTQAMFEKGVLAIARMVRGKSGDPKMGILSPIVWPNVDVLLWVQVCPTLSQRVGVMMDYHYVDALRGRCQTLYLSLTLYPCLKVGRKDHETSLYPNRGPTGSYGQLRGCHGPNGGRRKRRRRVSLENISSPLQGSGSFPRKYQPWFDTRLSYNPAIHRTKQAQFHCAVVSDIAAHPLPPPNPEFTKYFDPPKRVVKTAKQALEECKATFNVKEGTHYPSSFALIVCR